MEYDGNHRTNNDELNEDISSFLSLLTLFTMRGITQRLRNRFKLRSISYSTSRDATQILCQKKETEDVTRIVPRQLVDSNGRKSIYVYLSTGCAQPQTTFTYNSSFLKIMTILKAKESMTFDVKVE
jgi:hypothetical protein